MKHTGENVVRIEAEALRALADRIAGPMAPAFQRAVDLMFCCAGRVVVTGMGKSGLIARKIAATLSSTGSPALYLHPVEALHGDLGMVVRGDVVLALSASGETEEILALLATIKRLQVPLITMTGDEVYDARVERVLPPATAGSIKGSKSKAKLATRLSTSQIELRANSKSKAAGKPALSGVEGSAECRVPLAPALSPEYRGEGERKSTGEREKIPSEQIPRELEST